jgi:DNA-binding CsgD family transcriptional regulator
MSNQPNEPKKPKNFIHTFTQRETECINQAIQGKAVSDIAASLDVSETTVYFYLNAIKKKFDVLRKTVKLE